MPLASVRVCVCVCVWCLCSVEFTPDVIALVALDALGDIVFLLEIVKNLRLGFEVDGHVVWDTALIRRHYFRSWQFALDVVTCLPIDLVQFPLKRFIPAVRIAKMLRLFQLFRLIEFIESSRSVSLLFRLSKLLFYTVIIAHVGACIKYPVLLKHPVLRPIVESRTSLGKYLLTLYWSLGSMVDRGDSNDPLGLGDYVLAVTVMFLGVLWVCNFAASLDQYTDSADATKKAHIEEYKAVKGFMDVGTTRSTTASRARTLSGQPTLVIRARRSSCCSLPFPFCSPSSLFDVFTVCRNSKSGRSCRTK